MFDLEKELGLNRHSFKKGDFIINKSLKNHEFRFKVLAQSKYSILVKDMDDVRAIPFTLDNKSFPYYKLMTRDEKKRVKKDYLIKLLYLNPLERMVDFGMFLTNKYELKNTVAPKTIKDYASNWNSHFITFFVRLKDQHVFAKQSEKYEKKTVWNLFKNASSHGPLWKGHKYQDEPSQIKTF